MKRYYQIISSYRGFSLIELLIVVAIMGILSGIVYANFSQARASARDDTRKSDLKQLALALEMYRAQHGRYPDPGCTTRTWSGHSPVVNITWGCQEDIYIRGLAPEFIPNLPIDPRGKVADRGFFYRVNEDRTDYKVMVFGSVEEQKIDYFTDEFARCPQPGGGCGSTVQRSTYAVYSRGAAQW